MKTISRLLFFLALAVLLSSAAARAQTPSPTPSAGRIEHPLPYYQFDDVKGWMETTIREASGGRLDPKRQAIKLAVLIDAADPETAEYEAISHFVHRLLAQYLVRTDKGVDTFSLALFSLNVSGKAVWDEHFAPTRAQDWFNRTTERLPEGPPTQSGGHDFEQALLTARARVGDDKNTIFLLISRSRNSGGPSGNNTYKIAIKDPVLKPKWDRMEQAYVKAWKYVNIDPGNRSKPNAEPSLVSFYLYIPRGIQAGPGDELTTDKTKNGESANDRSTIVEVRKEQPDLTPTPTPTASLPPTPTPSPTRTPSPTPSPAPTGGTTGGTGCDTPGAPNCPPPPPPPVGPIVAVVAVILALAGAGAYYRWLSQPVSFTLTVPPGTHPGSVAFGKDQFIIRDPERADSALLADQPATGMVGKLSVNPQRQVVFTSAPNYESLPASAVIGDGGQDISVTVAENEDLHFTLRRAD